MAYGVKLGRNQQSNLAKATGLTGQCAGFRQTPPNKAVKAAKLVELGPAGNAILPAGRCYGAYTPMHSGGSDSFKPGMVREIPNGYDNADTFMQASKEQKLAIAYKLRFPAKVIAAIKAMS